MRTTRRAWLAAGGAAAIGTIASVGPALARDLTATEQANVKVVADFSAAWATGDVARITSYLADDCVVRFLQTQEPVRGRAAVAERLGKGTLNSKVEFVIHETFAAGELVTNLRDDHITDKQGKKQTFRVAGVFYVRNGKIVEWVDSVVNRT